ncbi:BlaI/MecI/CopY family transcriptional regulator [Planctomycetota bacterium]
MSDSESHQLSRRERQIMDVLFHLGEASVANVRKNMTDPPGYTAVRTTLTILEEKGLVTHREDGRRYVYKPRESTNRVGKSAMKRVVNVFFSGSLENALAAHLGDPKTKLSRSEVDRLRKLIEQAQCEE